MELRVHGIGGTSAASMLDLAPDAALVPRWPAEPGAKPCVFQGNDPEVTAYHWASLTSGSRWFVLWPLLLPFTLLNVAGFMYPVGPLRSVLSCLHRILCLVATVWFASWVVLGAQLIARSRGWSEPAGVALAAGLGLVIAGASRTRRTWPSGEARRRTGDPRGTLRDPEFFREGRIEWVVHVVAFAAVIVGTSWWAAHERLATVRSVGADLVATSGAVCVALLWLLVAGSFAQRALTARDVREPWTWTLRSAGTVGLGLAFIGGLVTALLRVLVGPRRLRGAPFALFDVYGWSILAAIAAGVATAVVILSRKAPGERVTVAALVLPDPVSWLRARVAQLPRAVTVAAGVAALTFVVLASTQFWDRAPATTADWLALLGIGDGATTADRIQEARTAPSGAAVRIAQWTIYGLFTVMFVNLLRSWGAASALRRVGSLWDVLAFWPRTFHPFAVRPYSTCAVDQLRELLFDDLDAEASTGVGGPNTVVAHSQGSMLVIAALAPERGPDRDGNRGAARSRVGHLVTAGSPVRALYQRAFPVYVDHELIRAARRSLAPESRWTNLFRFTDHVGRSAFVDEGDWRPDASPPVGRPQDRWWAESQLDGGLTGIDCALSDPTERQQPIQGHNGYWTDPRTREAVREWRASQLPREQS